MGRIGTSLPVACPRVSRNRLLDGWTSLARTTSSKQQQLHRSNRECQVLKTSSTISKKRRYVSSRGSSFVVKEEELSTIAQVKHHVALRSGVHGEAFNLVKEGTILRDHESLGDDDIMQDVQTHMCRGGAGGGGGGGRTGLSVFSHVSAVNLVRARVTPAPQNPRKVTTLVRAKIDASWLCI